MVMHDSRTRECKTASACTPPFARFACSRSCYGQVSDVLKDDPFSLHPKGSSQKRLIDQKSAYHSDFIYSPNHRCVPDLPSLPKTSQQNRIGAIYSARDVHLSGEPRSQSGHSCFHNLPC
jgi:hypothetical protein